MKGESELLPVVFYLDMPQLSHTVAETKSAHSLKEWYGVRMTFSCIYVLLYALISSPLSGYNFRAVDLAQW